MQALPALKTRLVRGLLSAQSILLLIYQGYTLSVSGIASPWIAKSFHLSQPALCTPVCLDVDLGLRRNAVSREIG